VPAPPAAFAAPFHEQGGREAAGAALDQADRPTALVCASDEIALGAYQAAADRGLRPGTDIAVTGWDDIQLARFVTPALTTVRQPMTQLGETAATLLAERVSGGHAESVVLASDVVIRASCGCADQPPTTREVVQ
jgi:LacI family transcriptional regulator